nr:aspartate/glutamate racemase family protein [uncultured Cohaesibacter sp.]
MSRIIVLNPNSSRKVTDRIATSLMGLAKTTSHEIICDRLINAPLGIETDADVATVGPMVVDYASNMTGNILVAACFSDPGVETIRQQALPVPVIGISEAGYYSALQLGRKFGVISLGPSSIARHAERIRFLGLEERLAGDLSADLSVEESGDPGLSRDKVIEAGKRLAKDFGADVLILGCAGMGAQRPFLQEAIGLPVVDPVQAGVSAALNFLNLNYNIKA